MRRGQIFVIICLALYLNQINGWSYDNGAQICANTNLGSPLDLKSTLYCGEEEHWRRFELNFNISTAVEYTHTLDNFHNFVPKTPGGLNLYITDTESYHGGYNLHHIEIHTPAEHTINGQDVDLELQVHMTAEDVNNPRTAVLSYLFKSYTDTFPLSRNYNDMLSAFTPEISQNKGFAYQVQFTDGTVAQFRFGEVAKHPTSASSYIADIRILVDVKDYADNLYISANNDAINNQYQFRESTPYDKNYALYKDGTPLVQATRIGIYWLKTDTKSLQIGNFNDFNGLCTDFDGDVPDNLGNLYPGQVGRECFDSKGIRSFVIQPADLKPSIDISQTFHIINDLITDELYQGYYNYVGSATHPPIGSTDCPSNYVYAVFQRVIPVTVDSNLDYFTTGFFAKTENFGGSRKPIVKDFNRKVVKTGCVTSDVFFETQIRSNGSLWFIWTFILFYFIGTIATDKNFNEEPYGKLESKERINNKWTLHPWYSVIKSGHDIYFPKTVRTTIMALQVSGYMIVNAGFYYHYKQPGRVAEQNDQVFILAHPFIAICIVDPIMYLIGRYISAIYPLIVLKFEKEVEAKHALDQAAKDQVSEEVEKIEQSIYTHYFVFYLFGLILEVAIIACTIMALGELDSDIFTNMWIASVLITAFVEYAIFDVIVALIGGNSDFLKRKGFWYDHQLEEKYNQSIKDD